MDRISLKAEEREVLGKKVKKLRKQGLVPGHVFGNKVETEHVSVDMKDFMKVYNEAGETGLIDLKIGAEKVRPVLIREVQEHPVTGEALNIDFYQVNLKQKVVVPVPLVLEGEEIESVKMGETVVLQTLSEVQVEALPTDLVESIIVDTNSLKQVDDAITVGELKYDKEKLTILAEDEEVVVKLAPAVTEEMKQLMEEQEAEAAAAQEAAEAEAAEEAGEQETEEGEEGADGEGGEEGAGEAVEDSENTEDNNTAE